MKCHHDKNFPVAMRYLDLLRHAKAEPNNAMGDTARALTETGRETAATLCTDLRDLHPAPSFVLCSRATRTRQTLNIIQSALSDEADIETSADLYNASTSTIYELIKELPDAHSTVLLIGHNPGLSEIVNFLSATPLALQPADYVRLAINIDHWANVMPGEGRVFRCFRPSILPQE